MRCLRRAPLDFICREFFQVCDAGLQSLDGLSFADIAVRALMVVMVINSAVTGGTGAAIIGGGSKVVVRVAIVVC